MSGAPPPQSLKVMVNYGISSFLLGTGLFALLSPTSMAAGFGMPVEDGTIAAGFVQCFGARNLTLGLLSAILVTRRDLKSAGTLATLLAVDGILDGLITWKYAGLSFAVSHFVAAAAIPFISAWMAN